MSRAFDGYYDPPGEPEYTPAELLGQAVDALLLAIDSPDAVYSLGTLRNYVMILRAARANMDELSDYNDPIDAGVPIAAQQAEYEALVNIDEEVNP